MRRPFAFALRASLAMVCCAFEWTVFAGAGVWTSGGPYGGGTASQIVVDPQDSSTVYATFADTSLSRYNTAYAGVFKSTDSGGSWVAAGNGLANLLVYGLAIDPLLPSKLYAASSRGVFKSTDAARTWDVANTGMGVADVHAIALDPSAPSTLYAGAYYAGFFKSTDAARTWSGDPGFGGVWVDTVAIDPATTSTLYRGYTSPPCQQFCEASGHIEKSTDSGATWASSWDSSYSVTSLAIDPANPSNVYAGAWGAGLVRSTDAGRTWASSNAPGTVMFVLGNSSLVWAFSTSGLSRSTDSAATWSLVSASRFDALGVDPRTTSILYSGTQRKGLSRSTDSGNAWVVLNVGLTNVDVKSLAIDRSRPSTLLAGTSYDGLYRTTDSGATWTPGNAGPTGSAVWALIADPSTPSTFYATIGGHLYKSTDSGSTWQAISTFVSPIAVDPLNDANLYGGLYGGIYKSTDSGVSWAVAVAQLGRFDVVTLAIDPASPSTLYCGDSGGGLYKSTDAGVTWASAMNGLAQAGAITQLLIDSIETSRIYAVSAVRGLFRSTDSAGTWATVPKVGLSGSVSTLLIDPIQSSRLYTGTSTGGVFRSTDSGDTWIAVKTGAQSVTALALDSSGATTLYAGLLFGSVWQSMPPSPVALKFYTLVPCRVLDTRGAGDPLVGPAIQAGWSRDVPVEYRCGVPPDAIAFSGNLTVVQPTASGGLRVFPAGQSASQGSTISYTSGRTRATNGLFALSGPAWGLTIENDGSAPVDVLLDVTGYFK